MDDTEQIRREMIETGQPMVDAIEVISNDGPTWDTAQLQQDFEVLGFSAPFVVVKRRSDGQKGSLEFTHSPRIYFNFVED